MYTYMAQYNLLLLLETSKNYYKGSPCINWFNRRLNFEILKMIIVLS